MSELQAGAGAAPKKKLGFSKDVEGKSGVPIPAPYKMTSRVPQYPNGYHFPICKLVNVVADANKEVTRNGITETSAALTFVFRTEDGKQYTHIEWPVDDTDEKFQEKYERLTRRIKHIFEETLGGNNFKEFEAEDFADFFKQIADQFNSHTVTKGEGENVKTIKRYSLTRLYIKLTYNGTRLQTPLYPNFVQNAGTTDKPAVCDTLTINPQYDKIEAVEVKKPAPFTQGTEGSFGGTNSFDSDFPDLQ